MAVQQSRSTRSKRGMRRSHHALPSISLSLNKYSNEIHLRHHITLNKIYKKYRLFNNK
ncbi:MAG: 50S ribosomal protein L32 [Candidatus Lightella neohaematopini]|nr:50S ribosomal protein L32 [Candidatus Lightella neohaematopini]MCV2528701.1 50S ribosomal protein L32 [Candidatus Lightella neohaematopini]